jgi:cytochrome P450
MLLTAAEDAQDTGMSDQQIRDEIITLFIAGHETTSVTLTWAFWLLGRHPAVLEALSDEVDTRLGAGRATPEQLAGLQMPTRIIRETLRLYPTAWILFNRLAAEPAQLHDIAVMPGEIVILSPYAIQRDPRYFPDPDAFNPAHFVDGWEKQREKFCYFPFGGGSRICIGQHFALMEAAFLLAMVAQRFRFRLTMPEAHITPQPLTTLQPDVPIEIELIAR